MSTRRYRIVVAGELDDDWCASLGDVTVECDEGRTTLLTRPIDQAALNGLLERLRMLGMELITLHTTDTLG